jgi:hypothetical protein
LGLRGDCELSLKKSSKSMSVNATRTASSTSGGSSGGVAKSLGGGGGDAGSDVAKRSGLAVEGTAVGRVGLAPTDDVPGGSTRNTLILFSTRALCGWLVEPAVVTRSELDGAAGLVEEATTVAPAPLWGWSLADAPFGGHAHTTACTRFRLDFERDRRSFFLAGP